jgi:hypothetical protein
MKGYAKPFLVCEEAMTQSLKHMLLYGLTAVSMSHPIFAGTVAGSAPAAVKITTEQMEHLVALGRIQTQRDNTLRLAGVAFSVHYADALAHGAAVNTSIALGQTPNLFYDQAADQIYTTTNLPDVAARKSTQLDKTDMQNAAVQKPPNSSVASLVALDTGNPSSPSSVLLLYPPSTGETETLVSSDPLDPSLWRDFAVAWVAWAYDQVRLGTTVGQVLAPYVKKYSALTATLSADPAVILAENQVQIILTEKQNNTPEGDILNKMVPLNDVEAKINQAASDLHQINLNAKTGKSSWGASRLAETSGCGN